jgi:hypothetical protein
MNDAKLGRKSRSTRRLWPGGGRVTSWGGGGAWRGGVVVVVVRATPFIPLLAAPIIIDNGRTRPRIRHTDVQSLGEGAAVGISAPHLGCNKPRGVGQSHPSSRSPISPSSSSMARTWRGWTTWTRPYLALERVHTNLSAVDWRTCVGLILPGLRRQSFRPLLLSLGLFLHSGKRGNIDSR